MKLNNKKLSKSNQKFDEKYREPCTIKDVYYGFEDHGIRTVYITVNYDRGAIQSFGGLMFGNKYTDDKLAKIYIKDICDTFGVSSLDDLKGKRCFALKCFGGYNEDIEGLETLFGARFLRFVWCKKYMEGSKSPLENKIEGIKNTIDRAKRTLIESEYELNNIKTIYKDWTK